MNKEWKDKWVAALRSDGFEQGTGQLRNASNQYCCLGVLCRITEDAIGEPFKGSYYDDDEDNIGYLPERVASLVLFNDASAHYDLVELNDSKRKNFNEIADYIEEHF
jgi:hypothetical protein